MYKAVLVDDESFDLLGLQRLIPWESLGIEAVFATNRPQAALEYALEHAIDILITDIKMPVMSGIELARECLQRHPSLKTVFISGYQQFDYAKQALQLKADGYILKPVDDDEVVATLQHIVSELSLRKSAEKDRSLEDFMFIRNDFLLHLMEGSLDQATIHTFMRKYPFNLPPGQVRSIIIEVDVPAGHREQLSFDDSSLYAAVRLIEGCADMLGLGAACRLSKARTALIAPGGYPGLNDALEELLAQVRSGTEYTATIAYGRISGDMTSLPESYWEARDLISCKMFLGKDRVIAPDAPQLPIIRDTKDVNASLDELFAAITNYGLVDICDRIDDLFANVKHYTEPVKVYHFSTHIVSRLEGSLNAMGESIAALEHWKAEGFAEVERFETIEDIKSWLRRTAFELSELLYMKKQKPAWKLLPDIERYVRGRLSGDITLKEAAARFAYSANHFGVLFKEQVGMSFNDYVVRERMERAKGLLKNGQLKVYEIAEEVGYNSLAYFSKTFREMFGMTPGDYRKQS